jgi:hypothetical protein
MSPQSPKREPSFRGEEFQKAEVLEQNIHNDWRQQNFRNVCLLEDDVNEKKEAASPKTNRAASFNKN